MTGLEFRSSSGRRRGAEHVAFAQLFARSFDSAARAEFRSLPPESVEEVGAGGPRWVQPALGVGGGLLMLVGGASSALALQARASVGPEVDAQSRAAVNARIDRYNALSVGCYAAGAAALAGFIAWTLWPEAPVAVQLLPGEGAVLGVRMALP
jgi:hypothetical protein